MPQAQALAQQPVPWHVLRGSHEERMRQAQKRLEEANRRQAAEQLRELFRGELPLGHVTGVVEP